jgi:hypothetical protein
MTWAYEVLGRSAIGKYWMTWGTFTGTGATTGGDIVTGLKSIKNCMLLETTGVTAAAAVDYATTAGTMIVTGLTAAGDGTWVAIGLK